MILENLDEAVAEGARLSKACEILELDIRTVQRWRSEGGGTDRSEGPKTEPKNKISPSERKEILEIVNSPQYRDLSAKQIVPALADRGLYFASESTVYRARLKTRNRL